MLLVFLGNNTLWLKIKKLENWAFLKEFVNAVNVNRLKKECKNYVK